jgi:septal ring factor EnvC (AmiA/AmiB activator)
MVHQVRSLVRFLALIVLLVAVIVAINSVVSSHMNAQLDKIDQNVEQQGENINGNTKNIQEFGAEVKATKATLEKAIKEVQDDSGDSEFTTQIKRGLEQIDKLCQQTNCEG